MLYCVIARFACNLNKRRLLLLLLLGVAVLRDSRRSVGRQRRLRRAASVGLHCRRAVTVSSAKRNGDQRLHVPQHVPLSTHRRRRL